MKLSQIIEKIEDLAPLEFQEDWDNSGVQISLADKEVKGISLCLDLSMEALDEAISSGHNLIISHHPLIFSGLKSIKANDPIGDIIIKAIQNDIAVYSSHTSLDAARGGVNDALAKTLGYELENILDENESGSGIGRFGYIEEISLRNLALRTSKALATDLIYYGDGDKKINRLAVAGGSGASFISKAIEKGCDCLITGDIKHHDQIDALARGLAIIDAGHFASEQVVLKDLKSCLESFFEGEIFIFQPRQRKEFIKIEA